MSKDTKQPYSTAVQLTITEELIRCGKALGTPVHINGHKPSVIVPEGYKVEAIPFAELPPLPDHIRQSVRLSDAESFIAYVKRYKISQTVIFATLPQSGNAQFQAIFDYHVGGKGEDHKAARCAHRAIYPCPLSDQWKVWTGASGNAKSQADFIDFIEQNTPDITSPSSASLMELAINFESKTEVNFSNKVDRVTGGKQLVYSESVEARNSAGAIQVPDRLELLIPVFEGGKPYKVAARLEWIPRNGKLSVVIHLLRPDTVIREALKDLRAEIAAAVEIEPMTGEI